MSIQVMLRSDLGCLRNLPGLGYIRLGEIAYIRVSARMQ